MRSATEDPCGRPATVEILGIPFCKRCAREHEEYAAIGALTDPYAEGDLDKLREASLAESIRMLRRERSRRIAAHEAPRQGQPV